MLVDDLIAARALIDTPEKWQKRAYGKLHGGRYCVLGACREVTGQSDGSPAMEQALEDALPKPWGDDAFGVIHFNDAATTTHADIMAWLDRAITKARTDTRET